MYMYILYTLYKYFTHSIFEKKKNKKKKNNINP